MKRRISAMLVLVLGVAAAPPAARAPRPPAAPWDLATLDALLAPGAFDLRLHADLAPLAAQAPPHVPEPGTLALAAVGLTGLASVRRVARRRRA